MYKTTITYTVLSEEPIPGHADLEYIAKEAYDGHYVGTFNETKEVKLSKEEYEYVKEKK